jgi:tetraacyldisaccharide 4'-kinase
MQFLKFLLIPFSLLYGFITWVRNKLFDWKLKPTYTIPAKSICVGNLNVGGTGKTPHVQYLSDLLIKLGQVNIVSRGYGRKTKGLIEANERHTVEDIGDEPKLYVNRKNGAKIWVSEKRKSACESIISSQSNPIILLDDAFQHRHIEAGLQIVLTDFSRPFFKDYMLPTGFLREFRSGIKRADIVVVTKCPKDTTEEDIQVFIKKIKLPKENIYFSQMVYGPLVSLGPKNISLDVIENIVLVCGIAQPKPLIEFLEKTHNVRPIVFSDHHPFSKEDIKEIHQIFGNFARDKTIVVTTEKDAVRLQTYLESGLLRDIPWYVQGIRIQIDRKQEFEKNIINYVTRD